MTGWYVCLTKPRSESLASAKLREQGYEVLLPMLTHWERKQGVWRKSEQIMFPRYLFLRCGRADQSIAPIRSTPGVSGLVRFGTAPALLAAAVVDSIREIAANQAKARGEEAAPFKVGEPVHIASGPLKGLSGIVSRVAEERIVVLLTLIGREQHVAVPANQLTPT